MTFRYTTIKRSCPKCKKVYEVYGDEGRSLAQKYAPNIIICPNCGHAFIDKSRKEIAITGIDEYDKQMFHKENFIEYSIIAIVGILFLLFWSKIFGALLLAIAVIGVLYRLLSYKPKMKKLKKLEQQSINRLNDKRYVMALLKFGISVPNKYLDKHNLNNDNQSVKEANEELQKNNEDDSSNNEGNKLDSLMTGQLVAFYKTTHNKDYSDEYERRLQHIGFTMLESKSLFMLELMMLKHDHIPILADENYLINNYFNLKTPILPLENSYYVEHQEFLVSEITKLWDEAEWVWTYKKDEKMPNDVVNEIFKITRYGGGELLIETLKSISEHSHIDFAKIQKYSKCEQDMMFKYKWNKNANEKHPYKIS